MQQQWILLTLTLTGTYYLLVCDRGFGGGKIIYKDFGGNKLQVAWDNFEEPKFWGLWCQIERKRTKQFSHKKCSRWRSSKQSYKFPLLLINYTLVVQILHFKQILSLSTNNLISWGTSLGAKSEMNTYFILSSKFSV